MVYVNEMGCLLQFTDRQWKQYCEHRAVGGLMSAEDWGGKVIATRVRNVTDWNNHDFREELEKVTTGG